MNKLIKIRITLTKNGFKEYQTEWDVKISKKVFILSRIDDVLNVGDLITRRIPINEVFNIKNSFNNLTNLIEYSTLCEPNNIEETRIKLRNKIIEALNSYKKDIEELSKFV